MTATASLKVLFALIERDVRERWMLLLAAALLGILILFSSWFPQAQHVDPSEIRGVVAFIISLFLVGLTAVGLGYSMLARELSEGRLAFFFVRPVSAAALWCGKVFAALLLLASSVLLVWLPTLVIGGVASQRFLRERPEIYFSQAPLPWGSRGQYVGSELLWMIPSTDTFTLQSVPVWIAMAVVFLFFITHTAAVILRSASPRLLLDLLALMMVGGLGWSAWERLEQAEATGTLLRSTTFLPVLVIAVLFVGGLVQTLVGRTSKARSHIALSATVWGLLLCLCAGFEMLSRRTVGAGLGDLIQITHVLSAPRGDWIVVAGPARGRTGYAPAFAFQAATGKTIKLGPLQAFFESPVFADNGNALAWKSCPRDDNWRPHCEVYYLDLSRPDAEPRKIGIHTRWPGKRPLSSPTLDLDATGQRLALVDQRRLSVYEIPQQEPARTLFVTELATVKNVANVAPQFRQDQVRIFVSDRDNRDIEIRDLDLATRQMSDPVRLPGTFHETSSGLPAQDFPVQDVLATWGPHQDAHIFRGDDLSLIASIRSGERRFIDNVRFLSDGGWAVIERAPTQPSQLRVFDKSGNEVWSLGKPRHLISLGIEESPGHLWIGFWQRGVVFESQLLNIKTGEVLLRKSGYLPNWHTAAPGQPAARLLMDPRGVPNAIDMRKAITDVREDVVPQALFQLFGES